MGNKQHILATAPMEWYLQSVVWTVKCINSGIQWRIDFISEMANIYCRVSNNEDLFSLKALSLLIITGQMVFFI